MIYFIIKQEILIVKKLNQFPFQIEINNMTTLFSSTSQEHTDYTELRPISEFLNDWKTMIDNTETNTSLTKTITLTDEMIDGTIELINSTIQVKMDETSKILLNGENINYEIIILDMIGAGDD